MSPKEPYGNYFNGSLLYGQKAVNMLFHILCERMEKLQSDTLLFNFAPNVFYRNAALFCFSVY